MTALTAPRYALLTASPDPAEWRTEAKRRAALWSRHERRCRDCRSGLACRVERGLHADAIDAEKQWDLAERRMAGVR